MKRGLSVLLTLLLLITLWPAGAGVRAATAPKLRILEITPTNMASTLTRLDSTKYEVVTMPMKLFTASREQLDGRYDAVYFAEGTYATTVPTLDPNPYAAEPNKVNTSLDRAAENKTQSKMNDLTPLKAEDIRKYYIDKGLPVIADDSVLQQACNDTQVPGRKCVLKTLFTTASKPNVMITRSAAEFPVLTSKRPRLQLTRKPVNYEADRVSFYRAGDELPFSFSVAAGTASTVTANLYMDTNYNSTFEPVEKLASYPLAALQAVNGVYSISYKLPRGFSSTMMWKVELTDNNELKDYETGVFRFKDEPVAIRVLQVTSDKNYTGSLLRTLSSILPSGSTVIQGSDYSISMDVTDMDNFNACLSSGAPCYKDLNTGKYNMVIFGFQDEYGALTAGKLRNEEAIAAVRRFVDSGQSVFLTHDTLYRPYQPGKAPYVQDTNVWFTMLAEHSGQTYPIAAMPDYSTAAVSEKVKKPGRYFMETNIGRFARVTVNNTKQVNRGLITLYPYVLTGNVGIATTHSQYFTLDINDPAVTPWYNLEGGANLDSNDSYNHYYIYSRKNVTYTGAGHTNTTFTAQEQQLFVNTMFTAFAGANHAPLLTVYAPETGAKLSTTQKVNVSFKVEDLDAKDRTLQTSVYFNDQLVYSNAGVVSGETINQLLNHNMTASGPLTVRIEASDAAGAKAVKTISLNVEKPNTNVAVTRSLSQTGILETNKAVNIRYTVKPLAIQSLRPFVLPQTIADWLKGQKTVTVPFSQFAAPNVGFLKFSDSVDADVQTGYPQPVSGTDFSSLQWVTANTDAYTRSLQSYVLAKGAVELDVPVVDSLALQQKASLKSFTKLRLEAVSATSMKITYLGTLEEKFTNLTNVTFEETFPAQVEVSIPDAWKNVLTKSGNLASGYTVTGTLGNIVKATSGYPVTDVKFELQAVPVKKGQYTLSQSALQYTDTAANRLKFETLTITAKDALAAVDAQDVLSLSTMSTPQKVLLQFQPATALEDGIVRSIVWSDMSKNGVISIDQNGVVTPLKQGKATVKVQVTDIFGNVREDTTTVLVRIPVLTISAKSEITLSAGDTASLDIVVTPAEARDTLEWTVDKPELISINRDRGEVTGLRAGIAIVTLTGYNANGQPVQKQVKVTVKNLVKSIGLTPAKLDLIEGESYAYGKSAITILPEDAAGAALLWTSDAPLYVSALGTGSGGTITALKSTDGRYVNVRVTAQDGSGVQGIVQVLVKPRYVPLQQIYFSPNTLTIEKGSSVDLSKLLVFVPANATNRRIVWLPSSDPRFVSLDTSTGVIKGVAKGYATITATAAEGSKKATITIQVVEPGTGTNPNAQNVPLFRW